MVTISLHARTMGARDEMSRKLTPEFVDRRGEHLRALEPLEDLVRELCPLPISYDVTRCHPPFFGEFAYTEMLGCFYAFPQSSELAARVVQAAVDAERRPGFDVVGAIMARPQMDKYALEVTEGPMPARVAFLPGTNLFASMASRELLVDAMQRYPDMMLKPHPMTNEGTIRQLGQLFHYDRILPPLASGWAYLQAADHVYVSSCTEMGLYAVLLGKRIHNISQVATEARGAYAPFYRLLWDLPPDEARAVLVRALNGFASGFVHPADPQLREKLAASFALAMYLRAPFRPLCHEYDPTDFAAMVRGKMRTEEHAARPGGERRGERRSAIPDDDGAAAQGAAGPVAAA